MRKIFFLTMLFLFSLPLYAKEPIWNISTNESSIKFTATQNNAPVTGEFKKFSGQIQGDINQLKDSRVSVDVDTGSVTTSFKDLEDILKATEWLNVQVFPVAKFESNNVTQQGPKQYQANGKLTIHKQSIPLQVPFVIDDYTPNKARISGSVIIKRTDFNIGSGEWSSTDEIKDDVVVAFKITAIKQNT